MGKSVAADAAVAREYVLRKAACARRKDLYALLSLKPDADASAVCSAHEHMVERLQADAAAGHVVGDLTYLTARIREAADMALSVLTDQRKRARYDADRGKKDGPPRSFLEQTTVAVDNDPHTYPRMAMSPTELALERSRKALAHNQLEEAEKLLRAGLRHNLEDAKLLALLGRTLVEDRKRYSPARDAEARSILEQACALAPYDAEIRYTMATYWQRRGEPRQFRLEIEATLRCDPNHTRARYMLEQLRRAAPQPRRRARDSTIFDRLMAIIRPA